MQQDLISLAWESAPMGEPLSAEERDLAEEGLAAIDAGEIVHGGEVTAEIAARQQAAG